jgi:hypothetical protein
MVGKRFLAMSRTEPPGGTPNQSLPGIIDLACDRFERAWMSDDRPEIEACLNDWDEPGYSSLLLRELLLLELHYRNRANERLSCEEYLNRFPQQRDVVEGVFAETVGSVCVDDKFTDTPTHHRRPGETQDNWPVDGQGALPESNPSNEKRGRSSFFTSNKQRGAVEI